MSILILDLMDKGNSANPAYPAYRRQAQVGVFGMADFFMHDTAIARSRTNI
jgi:hypothetical protein